MFMAGYESYLLSLLQPLPGFVMAEETGTCIFAMHDKDRTQLFLLDLPSVDDGDKLLLEHPPDDAEVGADLREL